MTGSSRKTDPTPSAEAVARELLRDITMRWMRHLEARVDVGFMDEWLDFAAPLFDDALSSARTEGRLEGLREAEAVCGRVHDWYRASNVGLAFTEQDCVDEFTADGAEECADALRTLIESEPRG